MFSVLVNTVLTKISGPTRDDVTVQWITLHTADFFLFLTKYHSTDQFKDEMGGTCGTYGERRGTYRVLLGKPEGKRPLGRPMRKGIMLRRISKVWDGLD